VLNLIGLKPSDNVQVTHWSLITEIYLLGIFPAFRYVELAKGSHCLCVTRIILPLHGVYFRYLRVFIFKLVQ